MPIMEDCMEWLNYVEDLIRELGDSKPSEFRQGQVDGLRMAADMLKDYLADYPGYVDPLRKFDQFKM